MTRPKPLISRQRLRTHYDVVIVGSGYGGAVAAYEIATSSISKSICVLEKGKYWRSGSFPRGEAATARESSVTIFNDGSNVKLGPSSGLHQLYVSPDSFVVTGCGVGGGSLINAGISFPTPDEFFKVDEYPKWPWKGEGYQKEWKEAIDRVEQILKPSSCPREYEEKHTMMDTIVDLEDLSGSLKQTISYRCGENAAGIQQDACVGCGDCASGCNDNAKTSLDKTFLRMAVDTGRCEIHVESSVMYLSKVHEEDKLLWRVHFDETSFIYAETVLLAAGVFGTNEILLRSKAHGLILSDRVGQFVSGNGDSMAVAYNCNQELNGFVVSIPATKEQLKEAEGSPYKNIPPHIHTRFQQEFLHPMEDPSNEEVVHPMNDQSMGHPVSNRSTESEEYRKPELSPDTEPQDRLVYGPCITRYIRPFLAFDPLHPSNKSHASFMLQQAMVPSCSSKFVSLFRTMDEDGTFLSHFTSLKVLRDFIYATPAKWKNSGSFMVIGHDDANGTITLSSKDGLEFKGPTDPDYEVKLAVLHDRIRGKLGGEVLQCPSRQSTAHLLGGAIAGYSAERAVVNVDGQVYSMGTDVHDGLYVCDASVFPQSLGVNPFLTISAFSSLCARRLVAKWEEINAINSIKESQLVRTRHYLSHIPPIVTFNEVIEGYCGRHQVRLEVNVGLYMNYYDGLLTGFLHAPWLSPSPLSIDQGSIKLFTTYERSPTIKYMEYKFDVADDVAGKRFSFRGKKTMHQNRFPVWGILQGLQETTTMDIRIVEEEIISVPSSLTVTEQLVANARRKLYYGKATISWWQLGKMGLSMRGQPFRILTFLSSFAGQLMGSYVLSPSFLHAAVRPPIKDMPVLMSSTNAQSEEDTIQLQPTTEGRFFTTCPLRLEFYTAKDGLQLSYVYCPSLDRVKASSNPPILLYAGMSMKPLFWLLDTVRLNFGEYLAQAGYDVYIMCHRSGDPFIQMQTMGSVMEHTGDDIAKYDIPGGVDHVIQQRIQMGDSSTPRKVHLIGFCWGGVGIHGSIQGGYVASSKIASIVTMSSAPYFDIPSKYHYLKNCTPLLPVVSTILHRTSGEKSYSFGRLEGRPWFEHVLRRVSSALSFYTLTEPCSLAGHSDHWCTNFGLCANPAINHDNVSTWTHSRLPDCFGPTSTKLLQHAADCHRVGRLLDTTHNDTYGVGTCASAKKYTFPVTIIMGEKNQVYTPVGGRKTIDWLLHHSGNGERKDLCVIPGYGHLDLIVGKEAEEEVYGLILKHLLHADSTKRSRTRGTSS